MKCHGSVNEGPYHVETRVGNSNVVNGVHVLQRKLKETTILNKYDLKWKETSENCKWKHCTR